jgi:hypothetical protein
MSSLCTVSRSRGSVSAKSRAASTVDGIWLAPRPGSSTAHNGRNTLCTPAHGLTSATANRGVSRTAISVHHGFTNTAKTVVSQGMQHIDHDARRQLRSCPLIRAVSTRTPNRGHVKHALAMRDGRAERCWVAHARHHRPAQQAWSGHGWVAGAARHRGPATTQTDFRAPTMTASAPGLVLLRA